MKLLLLAVLFLQGCSQSRAIRNVEPTNSPTVAQERPPDEFISGDIDRIAKLAALSPLKATNQAKGDVEVRVWYGFGLIALEGFVIKRSNNQWSALHLKADKNGLPYIKHVSRIQLPAPKSGWEKCWLQLTNAGVLTLPSGTEGPDPDVEAFFVETMDGGTYRNYEYITPEYSDTSNAKRMLAISKTISDEFGLKRFHVTKP